MRRVLLAATLCLTSSCAAKADVAPPPAEAPAEARGSGDRMKVGGAELRLHVSPDADPELTAKLQAWVRRSAEMVSAYYGSFPVPELELELILRQGRRRVGFGQAFEGVRIRINVGTGVTEAALRKDWVMVHEMLHLGFPDVEDRHRWMQEGMSTYLEPLVRARACAWDERRVWSFWHKMMHNGLPQAGDQGLDNTPTWGRIYWGGALFWLLADLKIREQTRGRRSLDDFVRGVVKEGGTGDQVWPVRRVVARADHFTKTKVVSELYAKMAQAPGDVDLEGLWRKLGIRVEDGELVFVEDAPWAATRRALSACRKMDHLAAEQDSR